MVMPIGILAAKMTQWQKIWVSGNSIGYFVVFKIPVNETKRIFKNPQ